jgi:hypothetical protein
LHIFTKISGEVLFATGCNHTFAQTCKWVRVVFGVDNYRFNICESNELAQFCMSFLHVSCMMHVQYSLAYHADFLSFLPTFDMLLCFLDFELSDEQYGHAVAIERLVPSLSYLRTELCSTNMSEACFWKIYFVLLHSKLSKQDAEILSTPQVYSLSSVLFFFLIVFFLSCCFLLFMWTTITETKASAYRLDLDNLHRSCQK